MTSREESEILRKRFLYRRLIMSGKIKLPFDTAAKFVGPDCAFHLYSKFNKSDKK